MSREVYETDFDGHIKAIVEIENNRIEILKAIDGYGGQVSLNRVKVTTLEIKQDEYKETNKTRVQ